MLTRLESATAALAIVVWIVSAPGVMDARAGGVGAWERVEATRAVRLFAPASGALLARTTEALLRSDDGGTTWRPVQLPADGKPTLTIEGAGIAVDPTNHDVLFVSLANTSAPDELYRTLDGGATWAKLDRPARTPSQIRSVVVSPADPRIVYASRVYFGDYALLLSRDRGETWEVRQTAIAGPSCGWGVPTFFAHPVDASQALRRFGCFRTAMEAESGSTRLDRSDDQGMTWQPLAIPGAVSRVAGGVPPMPSRLYASTHLLDARTPQHNPYVDTSYTTAVVLRSDNGLDGWTDVLRVPATRIDALAVDSAQPDRVFVGRSDGKVLVTHDAGASWSEIAEDIGGVSDLVLGIDGRNLYAATATGVWRLALPE